MTAETCRLVGLCAALSPTVRNRLCARTIKARYPAGQTFPLDIGHGGSVLLISAGALIMLRQRADGSALGSEYLSKGSIVGISSIFGQADDACFFTKKEVSGCLIQNEVFESLCQSHAELACEALRIVSNRFAHTLDNLEHIALNTKDKLHYLIEKLSFISGQEGNPTLAFTHEELALLAGVTRVTVSRIIDLLKQEGKVVPVGRGKIRLNL
jgi:CRP-like cAMP-binding protein